MKSIPLRNKAGTAVAHAIVDDEDFDLLNEVRWYRNSGYAARSVRDQNGKWKLVLMHRIIMGAKQGIEIDHKDGNRLNNQKNNLRLCSRTENMQNMKMHVTNRVGLKGVSLHRCGKYMAQIMARGVYQYLGLFETAISAHEAYRQASDRLHGQYGRYL